MAAGGGSQEHKSTLSSGSDIMYDYYCELCMDDGKNLEAEGYCIDCGEYLCCACCSGHTRSRQARHHKLLDKHSMPKDKPLPYDRVSKDITTICQFHSSEPVRYFCKSHSFLGCWTCFLTSHRSCKDFESISEKSENILESNEYRELLKLLKLLGQRARNVEKTSRANIKEVKSCYSKVIASINALKQQVIATFERLEKDAIAEADKVVSEEEQKMDNLASKCSSISDSVDSLQSHFQSLQSSKRVCQIYISMKQKSKEIQKLQGDLCLDEEALFVRKFSFEPDVKFQEIMNRASILGKLSVEDPVNSRRFAKFNTETAVKPEVKVQEDVDRALGEEPKYNRRSVKFKTETAVKPEVKSLEDVDRESTLRKFLTEDLKKVCEVQNRNDIRGRRLERYIDHFSAHYPAKQVEDIESDPAEGGREITESEHTFDVSVKTRKQCRPF